jgi:plastocyanin
VSPTTADKHATKRLVIFPALLATIAVLALAGCGGSKGSSSSESTSTPATSSQTSSSSTPSETESGAASEQSGSSSLKLAANPEGQLKYEPTTLTAKAGKVSIDFENASPVGHNVTIASSSGAVVGETPTFQGGSKTLSLNLKPGTYKFYCSVPGHRQAGMEGTLVVK